MTHPRPDNPYPPEALAACHKALRTLYSGIGPWGAQIVLIGGLVPPLLVHTAADHMPPHVGTTDLDLVIGLALDEDSEEAYRTLHQNLTETGFAPRRSSTGHVEHYRWERVVDGVTVVLELFCPAVSPEMEGRLRRNPGPGIGAQISAIGLRGAHCLAKDAIDCTLEGDLLDHGGHRAKIPVRVAGPLSFLMLKGFALRERNKDKDAYDVVWLLGAHPEGPDGMASRCLQSAILGEAVVVEAMECLAAAFAKPESHGPAKYANLMLGLEGSNATEAADRHARLRLDAFGTVQAFLTRMTNG